MLQGSGLWKSGSWEDSSSQQKAGERGAGAADGLFSGLPGKAQHFRFEFIVRSFPAHRSCSALQCRAANTWSGNTQCPSLHQTPRRHHSALSAGIPGWQSWLVGRRREGPGPWESQRGCLSLWGLHCLWEVTQRDPRTPDNCRPLSHVPHSGCDSPWSSLP